MSVALRIAVDRDPDVAVGTIATAATALVVVLGAAAAETPSRGLHLSAAWPFLLAGLLSPGAAQIFVTTAIRESGSSRVSMIFGTAPLVSVTIALVFLGEPATAPLIIGALLIVAGGVELARERDRPAHLNRIGLVFAFAGATLFAIRDNLVRHLAVGSTAVPPAVAAAAALLGGLALIAAWARQGPARRWLRFVPAGLLFGASYVDALRGLLPWPGHRRGAARGGRVALRRGAFRAPSARLGAGGEAARSRCGARRRRRRADRRLSLSSNICYKHA
jgi:drug/metabolite transporter (DMT)-like permease